MKNAGLLCAVLFASTLVACATKPPAPGGGGGGVAALDADCRVDFVPKSEDRCDGRSCFIWVQYAWSNDSQKCEVLAGTTRMIVKGKVGEIVTIKWMLPPGSNLEFREAPNTPVPPFADPIIFKEPAQNAPGYFSNLMVTKPITFLDHKLSPEGKYNYKLKVYRVGDREPLPAPDPAIWNDTN
jgi:hypothetical protein